MSRPPWDPVDVSAEALERIATALDRIIAALEGEGLIVDRTPDGGLRIRVPVDDTDAADVPIP